MVIATIALKGDGFIAEIKQRNDITLLEMNPRNRDSLCFEILQAILPQDTYFPGVN